MANATAVENKNESGLETTQEPSRVQKKRSAILKAATEVFKEQGFVGASMDVIAIAAGVSKPTVYRYFDTKEHLFDAILDDAATRMLILPSPLSTSPENIHDSLTALAQRAAAVVLSDNLIALQRLAIAECTRFPSLTKRFYEHGPKQVLAGFKAILKVQSDNGILQIDDLNVATSRFWGLTMGMPHRTKLIDPDWNMSDSMVNQWISEGITAFIKLYAPADSAASAHSQHKP